MLKATDKEKLKKIGIDIDAIIAAHTDAAEKDIVVPDGELLTADQLMARDKNTKAEGEKEGKKAGEKEALTIAITEINKHTGLAIDAAKIERFGDLGTHLKTELGKTTDEKLKTVNQQVQDLLADKNSLTTERDNFKTAAETTKFQYDQFKHLPENRAKNTNETEYMALLSMRGVEAKQDGLYRNGEVMKDPVTKAPLVHKDGYKQLFDEFKWTAEPPAGAAGGRGGGNSGGIPNGGKSRNFSEAQEKWLTANPNGNLVSPEADAFIRNEAKDNPTFSYND